MKSYGIIQNLKFYDCGDFVKMLENVNIFKPKIIILWYIVTIFMTFVTVQYKVSISENVKFNIKICLLTKKKQYKTAFKFMILQERKL